LPFLRACATLATCALQKLLRSLAIGLYLWSLALVLCLWSLAIGLCCPRSLALSLCLGSHDTFGLYLGMDVLTQTGKTVSESSSHMDMCGATSATAAEYLAIVTSRYHLSHSPLRILAKLSFKAVTKTCNARSHEDNPEWGWHVEVWEG